jgi:hypothetical protein
MDNFIWSNIHCHLLRRVPISLTWMNKKRLHVHLFRISRISRISSRGIIITLSVDFSRYVVGDRISRMDRNWNLNWNSRGRYRSANGSVRRYRLRFFSIFISFAFLGGTFLIVSSYYNYETPSLITSSSRSIGNSHRWSWPFFSKVLGLRRH